MVVRCRTWHAIISLRQYTRIDDIRHDKPSLTLEGTHGMTMSEWHSIIALGLCTWSDNVRHRIQE